MGRYLGSIGYVVVVRQKGRSVLFCRNKFFKRFVAIKIAVLCPSKQASLTSESVQGTSLSFQGVDDIHSGDGLPLGVLGVCDSITNNIFQEYF